MKNIDQDIVIKNEVCHPKLNFYGRFNLNVFIKNIDYLFKTKGGSNLDFTEKYGINKRYIERIKTKEYNPQYNFIYCISDYFNISIDTMMFCDLESLSDTEKYLLDLLTDTIRVTTEHKVEWEDGENRIFGSISDLSREFQIEHYFKGDQEVMNYYQQIYPNIFKKYHFDVHTVKTFHSSIYNDYPIMNGEIYSQDLGVSNSELLLVKVFKSKKINYFKKDLPEEGLELYLLKKDCSQGLLKYSSNLLCDTYHNPNIATDIFKLYASIKNASNLSTIDYNTFTILKSYKDNLDKKINNQ